MAISNEFKDERTGVAIKQNIDTRVSGEVQKCDDHALIYAFTGVLDVTLPNGTTAHLLPDHGLLHAAGETYKAASIKSNTFITITYPVAYLADLSDSRTTTFGPWHSQIIPGDAALTTLMNMIDKEITARDHHTDTVLRLLTQHIAIHLIRNYSTINAAGEHTARRPEICQIMCALEYIETNLNENTSISDLVSQTQLSKHRFLQTFKEITGHSPQQYMIRRRLETARHLLRRPDLNLEQIAKHAGFVDQSHFSKTYRKQFGHTPALYRRN
jgi:AraC-like DNA-binding protein